MVIVIKLDGKDYEALNKVGHNGLEFNDTLEGRIFRAVANGTPLISEDIRNEISLEITETIDGKMTEEEHEKGKKMDNLPSCNSCVHNG